MFYTTRKAKKSVRKIQTTDNTTQTEKHSLLPAVFGYTL